MNQIYPLAVAAALFLTANFPGNAAPSAASSTEEFLDHLGVNTHIGGLTPSDPWNTDTKQIAAQLTFIGVRLDRDWSSNTADAAAWQKVQSLWPHGKFWSSIAEGSPGDQRQSLRAEEGIATAYPGLIYVMGGPNEEDDDYAQKLGATLTDSVLVQQELYAWAHPRGILVSQMEFGAGWTADNNWEGDYNPKNAGDKESYVPGPADFAGAHTYLSDPNQTPSTILVQLRTDALLATPGKRVAHTEAGAYHSANLTMQGYGQYMVEEACDSYSAGDAAFIIYGLQDSVPENTFGFYSFPQGIPNPAAQYYHTLTTLLSSKVGTYGPGEKPTFTPGSLDVTYSSSETKNLLLQKPDKSYIIADWSEQHRNAIQHLDSDTVIFGKPFSTVSVYDVEQGLTPIDVLHGVSQYTLNLAPNDMYLIDLQ